MGAEEELVSARVKGPFEVRTRYVYGGGRVLLSALETIW